MGGRLRSRFVVAAVSVAAVVSAVVATGPPAAVAAPSPDGSAADVAAAGYRAVIRRTSYGVPHVQGGSLGNVTFGQGYAYAADRFCDLADQIVKVRSERSRWFGPGEGNANLASDIGYKVLKVYPRAQEQYGGLTAEEREIIDGYVAGFNTFLERAGAARVPGWCRGAPWIAPITAVDVLAYQRDLALLASGQPLVPLIAAAAPPGTAATAVSSELAAGSVARLRASGVGSNGWAIGADRSTTGKGMLVGNPHFPWQGELKFWESHLTVPGKLNVYGTSLGGLPGVQIGFTDRVAWTHTVAAGSRFTYYTLDLAPGSPTTYLVDGRPEAMVATDVTVLVKTGSGPPQPVTRTMWSTRYGPVLDLSFVDPAFGWTTTGALTYRDANIDNDRMLRQWFTIARAQDVAGIRAALAQDQGIPWVNTIASDSAGNAFYTDSSQTPALSDASIAEWAAHPLNALDGSRSANAWVNRPGARTPGLLPYGAQPQLMRRDYVFNSNDSHWVVHGTRRLTGYSPLQGSETAPLSVRTRQNLRLLGGSEPGTVDSKGRFTVGGLGTAILSGSSLTGDELAASTVAACRQRGRQPVDVDGTPVDITPACTALAGWDRRFELNSRGAVLWRETVAAVTAATPSALTEAGPLFGEPFDQGSPTDTPRGAPTDPLPLLTGLARAMLHMRSLGYPLNVAMGAVQYTVKGQDRIAVPGSTEDVGIANLVEYASAPGSSREPVLDGGTFTPGSDLTERGYVVNYGTSFLLTVGFTAQGPDARCLLSFGQSADPGSPHFADQTRLFTQKRLRECRFSEDAIRADPNLRTEVVVRG